MMTPETIKSYCGLALLSLSAYVIFLVGIFLG